MNDNNKNRCINCNSLVEEDDNFCYNCGHWTSRGYMHLKDKNNIDKLTNGTLYKQKERLGSLLLLTCFGIVLLFTLLIIRGDNILKPYYLLKKQITSYIYGYNSSVIKTDNKYNNLNINTEEDAKNIIKTDFEEQKWLCSNDIDVTFLENNLEEKYNILNVNFCDISLEETKKISETISKIYELFPEIKGSLTNITITNTSSKSDYIAYFQPLYQFVNINNDINYYNKVNKTQILINSYYFLNEDIISKSIDDIIEKDWYVNGATLESTIAHEFGHYITFKILLNENNLNDIILVTKENEQLINNIIEEFDNGEFSYNIVNEALNNYNNKYNKNLLIDEFALSISNYAGMKDENGKLMTDETIAEAIHDYYLNNDQCKLESYEIINIIKSKL